MPVQSRAQMKAMFAAAGGDSTLGIPKKVGQEFVSTTPSSSLPEYVQAQRGHKAKTHRGRRSRGKGSLNHHQIAKTHLANAQAAPTPAVAVGHLFRALTSLKKAQA